MKINFEIETTKEQDVKHGLAIFSALATCETNTTEEVKEPVKEAVQAKAKTTKTKVVEAEKVEAKEVVETEKVETTKEVETKEVVETEKVPGVDKVKIRALATEKAKLGFKTEIKAKITELGGDNLDTMPENKYQVFVDYLNTLKESVK